MEDVLLTGGEVAKRLKVSRSYAYSLMSRGDIPTVRIKKVVRVRPVDLEQFIREEWLRKSIKSRVES